MSFGNTLFLLRYTVAAGVACLAALLCCSSLQAQATGLPVWNAGVMRGFTLAAEIAFPNQDYGNGTAYGIRGALGLGRFGLNGVISRYNVDDPFPNQTGVGLSANWRLAGRPSLGPSATLQGGAEFFALHSGSKLHLPIGLGLAVGLPTHRVMIRPWVAPRFDIVRNSFDSPTHTETSFGLSGGLAITGRRGFGITFAFDRTFAGSDPTFGGDGFNPSTISIGVQYHFRPVR